MTLRFELAVLSVALLSACDGGVDTTNPGVGGQVGGAGGGAGQGGGSAAGGDGGAGAGPSTCPEEMPSGACRDTSLVCDYVAADLCPERLECMEYLGTASWTSAAPPIGGSCSRGGQICTYALTPGDNPPQWVALECASDGTWQPHDLCPAAAPAAGAACDYSFLSCYYDVCGDAVSETMAYCNGGLWAIDTPCP